MQEMGNLKSNAIYNPNETRNRPPMNMVEQERDSDLEKYIRGKHQHLSVANVLMASFQPSTSSKSFLTSEESLQQNSDPRDPGNLSYVGRLPGGLQP